MDCAKIGGLIRSLRLEKGMTQRALAEKLNLSDKTISKWECGLGCPDVALLAELSGLLGADLASMLSGGLKENCADIGNLIKARCYLCSVCGGIVLATGGAEISCCGRRLSPLELRKADPEEALQLEPVEDEWHIFSQHPMNKENYIRFAAFQSADRAELVRLYPEWDLDFRIKRRSHGNLIWYAPDRGLLYQRI